MSWFVVLNWPADRGARLELWEKEICDSFLEVGLESFVCFYMILSNLMILSFLGVRVSSSSFFVIFIPVTLQENI